jgi:hypothetical protein
MVMCNEPVMRTPASGLLAAYLLRIDVPAYCDVALPVPLDRTFTYAVNGVVPVVGARVLVPFSGQMLMGVWCGCMMMRCPRG